MLGDVNLIQFIITYHSLLIVLWQLTRRRLYAMFVLTVLKKMVLLSCHAGQSGARDVIAKLRYDWSNDVGSYLAFYQVVLLVHRVLLISNIFY